MQKVADQEKAKHQDRALGLPLLRREGPQGEVRPRRRRGEAVPAARQDPRRHDVGGGQAVRPGVPAGEGRAGHPPRRHGLPGDPRRANTWACGTSIPTRATASSPGAWMSEYRTQEAMKAKDAVAPIVSNNSNFVKAKGAVLISWDDAVTMFHEFGHALHGLNSHVRYPTLAGTNTKRDFVEFPSQLNEHWLRTPGGAGQVRASSPDRQADPQGAGGQDQEGQALQRGLPHRRVPVGGDLRPEDPHRARPPRASTRASSRSAR